MRLQHMPTTGTGGNENEYHWCPTHWELRAEAEGENEDCESDEDSDPFAFRPTGRSQAR